MLNNLKQAELQTLLKIRLEKKLEHKLIKIFRKSLKFTIEQVAKGMPLGIGNLEQEISATLKLHYNLTGKLFGNITDSQLPTNKKLSGIEKTNIKQQLIDIYEIRAQKQAKLISDTTNKVIKLSKQNILNTHFSINPEILNTLQLDRLVANNMGKQIGPIFKNRSNNIALTETQNAAESAKAISSEVASKGRQNITKQWISQGDSLVREAHLIADGQIVRQSHPFRVGGENLNYPGDPTGSAANIIRCRCASIVNINDIISVR